MSEHEVMSVIITVELKVIDVGESELWSVNSLFVHATPVLYVG